MPFLHLTLPSALNLPFACSSTSHFWLSAILLCVVLFPPQTINVYPTVVLPTPFFHSTTLLLNPILPNPLLPNPCCAPYTLSLGSTPVTHPPCHPPNHFHPLTLILSLPSTIIHAPIWCRGRSPSIGPRAACSLNGMPSDSCSAYATTRQQLKRSRPDFLIPADLQANAGPAARDAFKRATDARAAWLACSFSRFLCRNPG